MKNIAFILSTGRTGTKFFENYINSTSKLAFCLHEPKPSWRFKYLSNMYLKGFISKNIICEVYKKSRKNIFKRLNNKIFIESSNFAFGCIPALNTCIGSIKILHIIRRPETYIQSHLNHGFWKGYKKNAAKYFPFWIENIKKTNNPIEILCRRWIYVNNVIASYSKSNPYLQVQFESIFSLNRTVWAKEINKIRDFFQIEIIADKTNISFLNRPANISNTSNKYILNEQDKIFIRNELENNNINLKF